MKRDESLRRRGYNRESRRYSSAALTIGPWRQNSLTINVLAQHSSYLAQLALSQHDGDEDLSNVQPVKWYELYRFATPCEIFFLLVAVFLGIVNGLFVPLGMIIYGEFTSLLIDRTTMTGTSTKCLTLNLFGGCESLTNASPETNRLALIRDSEAFGIGCFIFSVLQWVVAAISVDIFNYIALRQINRVKEKFLRSVLRQDIPWYDMNTTMNFATKVSDDIEKYREGFAEKVPILVYLVTSFVSAVVISFFYGWLLTLVLLSTAPVVIITTAIVAKVQSSLTTKELDAYSIAGVVAEEVLSSVRTVVAFGGEDKENVRYSERLTPANKTGIRKGLYSGIGSGVMWFIIYATYALAFWFGVGLILKDRSSEDPTYTPAVLMIVFFSILQGAQNVGLCSPHLESISAACASAASIFSVLDRKPTIDSMSTDGTKPEVNGDIELKDVYFQYPARKDVQVLNGISLKIPKNQTVALVGSSGCGKSTVLQLIQRMYDPDNGTVLASGHDLKNINVNYYRSHIAVVGQEPVLFAGSIKENIRLSNPSCTDEEVYAAAKQANCHVFIKKLPNGYDTQLGERGAQLSGGQKQRIAIARALVRKPKILLLDEATSALDSQSEDRVQKALDAASFGRTTVMVSHRLATVVNAHIIYFIDKGEVVESGTHMSLLAQRGRYYQLVLENEPTTLGPSISSAQTVPHKHARIVKKVQRQVTKESSSSSEESDEGEVESRYSISFNKEQEVKEPSSWRVMKLCAPEKWLMVVGAIAATVVGSSFPLFAVLFGETYGLLESLDENWVRTECNKISLLFLLVGVITGTAIFVQIYVFNLTGVRLTSRLRVDTFRAMLKQEIGWFDNPLNGVGALCGRLAADAAAVQGATGTRIGSLMQAAATIGIGIVLCLFYTWKLTLVSIINVPLVIGAVMLEGRILGAGMETMRLANERATTIATEAITNIRTVSAFCGEEGVVERYRNASKLANEKARASVRFRGSVFGFGQTAPVAGYALSFWYGGLLVANKELPYKDVIKVSEALIFGAWMLGQALAFAPNFGAALRAAGRVFELLERKPLVADTQSPCIRKNYSAQGKIQYKNINFRYPTRREVKVLNGLSLDVPPGNRVALVGPSGCGKSTLIQLLQRLYDPDEGRVYLDEYCIVNDMRIETLRGNLGIVSQEPVLFDRTIAENIAYGDNSRTVPIEEIVSAAKQANIHNFISALPQGYDTRIGARASHLSGGQKQRIAIARALVRNPRVLLLDEATSALDTHSEKIVQEALDRASKDRTCLIIAHRLATIQNADVICVIDQGVVAEKGTHSELIALKGIYAHLYELQCGIVEEHHEEDEEQEKKPPVS